MKLKTIKDKQYWLNRKGDARLIESEKIGTKGLKEILNIYEEALKFVNKELTLVYAKYAIESEISVDDLTAILSGSDKAKFLASIRRAMKNLGFKLKDVYNPNYLIKISRLDAFKEQIYWKIAEISTEITNISTKTYGQIVKEAYSNQSQDLSRIGVTPSFATIDNEVVNQILASKWVGSNYSKRVWKDTRGLAKEVKGILGKGLLTGQSYRLIANQIKDRFKVGEYVATRLVLTESNYFHNQANLQNFTDNGIEEYLFDAVMDGRTSKICRRHNQKRYPVKDARVGVNYPPLHPRCRSVPKAVISEKNLERRRPTLQ